MNVVLAAEEVHQSADSSMKLYQASHEHATMAQVAHMADLQGIQGAVSDPHPSEVARIESVDPDDPRVVLFE
jgi:hypothetical protein